MNKYHFFLLFFNQNYIRKQDHSKTNYNLVHETLQFLDCICGSTSGGLGLLGLYINESNVGLINQCLESLTEYCQGPCHENQVRDILCNLFSRNRSSLPSSSFVGRKNFHGRHTLCNTPFQRKCHILKRLFLDLRFWKHPMFCLVYCSVLVLKCCFFVILAKNSFIHSWYYFSSYLFFRPPSPSTSQMVLILS